MSKYYIVERWFRMRDTYDSLDEAERFAKNLKDSKGHKDIQIIEVESSEKIIKKINER